IGRQMARVAEVQRERQGILVSQRVARIEVEPREDDVVTLGDTRIGPETHQGIDPVGVNDDAAMLIPLAGMLRALSIPGPRQDVTSPDPQSQGPNQYNLKYLSSSHSLPFPMSSCHSSRLASTNRS